MKNTYATVLLALLIVAVSVNAYLNYRTERAVDQLKTSIIVDEPDPTWEYKCVESSRKTALREVGVDTHLDERFSELGADGWEMVGYGMNNGANLRYVCFKRPAR